MTTTESSADAPGRQLARVKQGTVVGVITLPCRHRILADGSTTPDKKVMAARINAKGAYCWHGSVYTTALDTYLEQAEGRIETASTRRDCQGWPSRYTHLALPEEDRA